MGIRSVLILAAVLAGCLPGQWAAADSIAAVASAPLSDPSNPFDASHAGNSYSLGAGTNFNPAGYDIRDLFGGQYDSYAPERGNVVFADDQPIGSESSVTVTIASPIALASINLWLADDSGGTGYRSTREFELFAAIR